MSPHAHVVGVACLFLGSSLTAEFYRFRLFDSAIRVGGNQETVPFRLAGDPGDLVDVVLLRAVPFAELVGCVVDVVSDLAAAPEAGVGGPRCEQSGRR